MKGTRTQTQYANREIYKECGRNRKTEKRNDNHLFSFSSLLRSRKKKHIVSYPGLEKLELDYLKEKKNTTLGYYAFCQRMIANIFSLEYL